MPSTIPKQRGNAFSTAEIGPDREDMAEHCGKAKAELHINKVEIILKGIGQKKDKLDSNDRFQHINDHYESAPL
jgi:hypothetical protein